MDLEDFLKNFSDVSYCYSDISDGNMSFRYGDAEEVIKNRRNFLKKKDLSLEDCVVMQVEHGDRIAVVDNSDRGKGALVGTDGFTVDALITKEKGIVLFLLTADCLPVAYFDPNKKVIGLAHLGWKSTEKDLASKVIDRMKEEFGTNPKDLVVLIGPGIRKDSYIFHNPAQKSSPEWRPFLEDNSSGDTKIDLVGYNKSRLLKAGVLQANIFSDDRYDTANHHMFYSHYRSARTREPEGRFATIIGLKKT